MQMMHHNLMHGSIVRGHSTPDVRRFGLEAWRRPGKCLL